MASNQTLVISNRQISNAHYFSHPEDLENYLKDHKHSNLLFVFWSWIVPGWMLERYNCYGCHTGPLLEKKGRGGSPIKNLQRLGINITTLCVFKMTEILDGGPVKLAIPMWINKPMQAIEWYIDCQIPHIVAYLETSIAHIPEIFKRNDVLV